jgi:hypothetical protein
MISQDEIIQQCVQSVLEGKATIAECAARYADISDLPQILEAAQAIQYLPNGKISPGAANRLFEQRLANRLKNRSQARKRHFPLTFTAALGAIFAVVLLSALAILLPHRLLFPRSPMMILR